jgi:hypothetical protein
MVNLTLDKNSSPISMTVTHVAVDGSNYNRHEQYTVNPELTGTQGKMEWFWRGTLAKNKSLRMKGAVIKNDSGIHYYETLTKGNRVRCRCTPFATWASQVTKSSVRFG